jgi:phospholipase/carboxylesterase
VTSHPFSIDVPVEIVAADRPDGSVVVALHGMGHSASAFVKDVLPLLPAGATAILPQGPYPYEMRGTGGIRQGNAWYVYTGESEAFLASMMRTESWLLSVVDAEIARLRLDSKRVALLGFSQGGYLAGFVGIRHARRFRGLVVAAGRIKDEALADVAPRATGLRVLDVHGAQDESVKPDACRASAERMAALGLPVEFRTYPSGHAVLRDDACRADVKAFLAASLSRA